MALDMYYCPVLNAAYAGTLWFEYHGSVRGVVRYELDAVRESRGEAWAVFHRHGDDPWNAQLLPFAEFQDRYARDYRGPRVQLPPERESAEEPILLEVAG
jgi:hypothetical protein